MPKYNLSERFRKILRKLMEVIKPRKPGFDLPIEDKLVDMVDGFYGYFPLHLKIGFPLGLLLLEYGTYIFNGLRKPFTKLDAAQAEQYIKSWINSKMLIRRDLIKGVKGIALTMFYSQPEAMAHIGYDIEAHLKRVNSGEPANPVAFEYFKNMNYEENSKIPRAGYDGVEFVCRDYGSNPSAPAAAKK